MLDSAQVLLPGIFLVTLTWLGARLAIQGKLSAGDIVAFYGYAFFLVVPIRTAIESADKFTRSLRRRGPDHRRPRDPAGDLRARRSRHGTAAWGRPSPTRGRGSPSSRA